jgi:exosome complex exonuclease DIS3/RRP44
MQLLDLLATSDADASIATGQQKKAIYPEYMSPLMVSAGVKSGELHQGHFSANPHNYLEVCSTFDLKYNYYRTQQGTVKVPAYSKPVLLVGRESMNRAVQGDIVAVEVFPVSEWKAPADAVVDKDGARLGQLPAVKLNSVHSCLARRRRGRFGCGRQRDPRRIHRASTGEQIK